MGHDDFMIATFQVFNFLSRQLNSTQKQFLPAFAALISPSTRRWLQRPDHTAGASLLV